MDRTLLLKLLTLVALLGCSSASDNLVNVSRLEMFVDDLPDMPRIHGYHFVNGVAKSKSLKIGMFKKKWVCVLFFFFLSLQLLNLNFFTFCRYCTCQVLRSMVLMIASLTPSLSSQVVF